MVFGGDGGPVIASDVALDACAELIVELFRDIAPLSSNASAKELDVFVLFFLL